MKTKSFYPSIDSLTIIILGCILLLGLCLRVVDLNNNPKGFFCDEASIGYNAYSMLTSGKDEHGKGWPLFFQAFGEYKNPVMTYSTIPLIFLFGLSETSVRLTSVVYGLLTILAIFYLGKRLGGVLFGIIAALLLAVSPWHIHFSRVSLEGLMPFTFFTTIGTSLWPTTKKISRTKLLLSLIFFVLAFYSYFPARLFIPPYLFLLVIINMKAIRLNLRFYFKCFLFTALLVIPMALHMLVGSGMSRWQQVKPDNLQIKKIAKLYLAHFSYDYLFSKGDVGYLGQFITRHSVRGIGELYVFQLPLIILSFFWIYRSIKKRELIVLSLLFWIFLYPIGTILTDVSGPQATRSIIGSVVFQLLTAGGFCFLVETTKFCNKNNLAVFYRSLLLAVGLFSVFLSLNKYLGLLKKYPQYSSDFWGWQYGAKPVMEYFLTKVDKYDQMCLEGKFNAPEIFIKFYDPKNRCRGKCGICGTNVFDETKKQLFAISEDTYRETSNLNSYQVKETIKYPNNKIAFLLVETKQ